MSLTLLPGCQKADEITAYTVRKLPRSTVSTKDDLQQFDHAVGANEPDQRPPDSDRMLGAIVPHGNTTWFFKATGPRDATGNVMEDFLSLIKSVRFADAESPPDWTLPEGWTAEKSTTGIRYATLKIQSDGATIETTVMPAGGDILGNVNRWCEQMGLPPKTKEDLAAEEQPKNSEVRQIEVGESKVTLVNLVGRMKGGGMSGAPFAGNRSPQPAKKKTSNPPQTAANNSAKPKWTVPEGWVEAAGNQFSLAAFAVESEGQSVKTTVTILSGGGGVLANVNRWRSQLQLPDWSSEEFVKSSNRLSVNGIVAPSVELVGKDVRTGEPASTLGVIVPRGDQAWFFKLTGNVALAQREKANFEAFVQSVKFD